MYLESGMCPTLCPKHNKSRKFCGLIVTDCHACKSKSYSGKVSIHHSSALLDDRVLITINFYTNYRWSPKIPVSSLILFLSDTTHTHYFFLRTILEKKIYIINGLNWATARQNSQNDLCTQRRLRSVWAPAQSDQSLRCALHGQLRTWAFFMRMPRLIFAGRTAHFVGFVVLRLIWKILPLFCSSQKTWLFLFVSGKKMKKKKHIFH